MPSPSPTVTITPTDSLSAIFNSLGSALPVIIFGAAIILIIILIMVLLSRRGRKKQAARPGKQPKGPTSVIELPPPPETMAPCPKCKTLNRSSAKFCKTCRTALVAAAVGTSLPQQPAPTGPLTKGTKPLSPETATVPLTALTVRTTIGQERYRIIEVVHPSKQLNRYLVESLQPQIHCSNCHTANGEGSQFCQECGNSLENVPAYAPRYRVKEVVNIDRFRTEYELAQLRLTQPNLISPRDAFAEERSGQLRYYVVLDELTWGTAAQITAPQDLPTVLGWGSGLAEGLGYLHQHRISLNRLTGGEVALIGKIAQWADFENARLVAPEDWQHNGTQIIAEDVRQLAELLYRLATGLTQFDSNNRTLTPKANAVFGKALGPMGYLNAEELVVALRDVESNIRRPGGIDLHVARLSDVGQERDLDEDSILTLDLGQIYRSVSAPLGVYAVADGMGGHEGGDVASRLAIRAMARRAVNGILTPALTDNAALPDYEKWIKESVLEANQAVLTQRKASRNDMGTTLVMAVIDNTTAYIAHVGDSRAYLIREGTLKPLTTDHSLVERLVATGQITRAEAATHPQKNVIYKNLGDKPQVEPDISRHTLLPDDKLVLCCDGLSGEISDETMLQIIQQSSSLPEACQQLVRAANTAGGHDNISVILISVIAID